MKKFDAGVMERYSYNENAVGIRVEKTWLSEVALAESDDWILVFPDTGKHTENCQKFIEFIDTGAGKRK